MKLAKLVVRGVAGTALLVLAAAGIALSQARIEMTRHGVHNRMVIPMGPVGSAGVHLYTGTGDAPAMPGFLDGPAVRVSPAGNWSADWFCEDRPGHAEGSGKELVIECAGQRTSYPLVKAAIPAAVFATPGKLAVLSDIEGNRIFLDDSLRKLGIVDADGNWIYGTNHLVIAGDSVDRGRDVFAVLWRLYSLSLQAQRSGGALHVLLGNHEQYVLRGNISRTNKEHLYALEQMGGHARAFAADTVLGQWLRAQPVVLKAGTALITHGGIAPQFAASGLTIEKLNDAMRGYWRGETAPSAALDAALGPAGVTQYRGYFEAGEERYPKASADEVRRALSHFGATEVVVGHTLVERVTKLHGGLVHAVDVNTDSAAPEALVFEQGKATVIDTGVGRKLHEGQEIRMTRPFRLTSSSDWGILRNLIQRNYQLSRLTYPY